MPSVGIRDLRRSASELVDRAARGEIISIARAGKPAAELDSLTTEGLSAAMLLRRWRHLPAVDPIRLADDIEAVVDPST